MAGAAQGDPATGGLSGVMALLHFDCRLRYDSGFELQARFEAGDGVTALFGPSGSGKSSTLALIAGTARPQTGVIHLAGRTLVDTWTRVFVPPQRRRLGVVFQDHLLFPHMTVRRNLLFGHGRRGNARPVDFARVVDILEIEGLLDRWPETLSGGQRQRVSLGRALLRGPEMLLLDEPLTALDEGLKDRVLTYLERALAEWRLPTVFVSHDQADVRRLADQVVLLEHGKVTAAGPTRATLDAAMMTGGRTAGPINFLRVADVRSVDGHWEGRIGAQRLYLPPVAGTPAGGVYVRFLAHDVVLGAEALSGLSVRNQLRGVVREVLRFSDRAFVAVDVGQVLWAEVTPESARELDLRPGKVVVCFVKASAITVLS